MKTVLKLLAIITVFAGMIAATTTPAVAVPAWARRTGFDCSGCHFGGTNRLTKMGSDFQIRGHRMPGEEGAFAEGSDTKMGDYLSFASKVRFVYAKDVSPDPSTEFDIESLAIYSGGPINPNSSYFFEFYMNERGNEATNVGGTLNTAVREKMADAYFQYNTDPSADTYTYVRAGQVYPFIIYEASSGGRMTISRPLPIQSKMADRNLYTLRDRTYGVTAGHIRKDGIRLEAGILNGGGGGNARANLGETNNFKDLFLSAQKEFDDNGSNIGVFLYNGKFTSFPTDAVGAVEDNFTRYALIGHLNRDRFVVSGGFVFGEEDLTGFSPNGWYLEGGFNVNPDLTAFARVDEVSQDNPAVEDTTGFVLGLSQRVKNSGRIAVEFSNTESSTTTQGVTAELNWLF